MTSMVICKGCGKSYETSFGEWYNADLCRECFNKGEIVIDHKYRETTPVGYHDRREGVMSPNALGIAIGLVVFLVCLFAGFFLALSAGVNPARDGAIFVVAMAFVAAYIGLFMIWGTLRSFHKDVIELLAQLREVSTALKIPAPAVEGQSSAKSPPEPDA